MPKAFKGHVSTPFRFHDVLLFQLLINGMKVSFIAGTFLTSGRPPCQGSCCKAADVRRNPGGSEAAAIAGVVTTPPRRRGRATTADAIRAGKDELEAVFRGGRCVRNGLLQTNQEKQQHRQQAIPKQGFWSAEFRLRQAPRGPRWPLLRRAKQDCGPSGRCFYAYHPHRVLLEHVGLQSGYSGAVRPRRQQSRHSTGITPCSARTPPTPRPRSRERSGPHGGAAPTVGPWKR